MALISNGNSYLKWFRRKSHWKLSDWIEKLSHLKGIHMGVVVSHGDKKTVSLVLTSLGIVEHKAGIKFRPHVT